MLLFINHSLFVCIIYFPSQQPHRGTILSAPKVMASVIFDLLKLKASLNFNTLFPIPVKLAQISGDTGSLNN